MSSNKKIILHIFQRSIFLKQYLDLLVKTDSEIEHVFLIYGTDWHTGQVSYPEYDDRFKFIDIEPPNSHIRLDKIYASNVRLLLKKCNLVIVHALHTSSIIFLYLHPYVLKKTLWLVWGEELLYYKGGDKSNAIQYYQRRFVQYIKYILKKLLIKRIKYVQSTSTEYNIIKKYYSSKILPLSIDCRYGIISIDQRHTSNSGHTNIVIGHSGFPTGKHIDVLDLLSKFKNEDITIYLPLSYGFPEYIETVKYKAYSIFKEEKVVILSEFMNQGDYYTLLSKMDVGIYNAENQTGLGNIWALFLSGAKIYLNKDGINCKIFSEKGLHFYSVSSIASQSYIGFREFDTKSSQNNVYISKKILENESEAIRQWENIFNLN